MNAWVLYRNESVFGVDVEEFRPERWLQRGDENNVDSSVRLEKMKQSLFTFEFGSRGCIGKNLSLLEFTS